MFALWSDRPTFYTTSYSGLSVDAESESWSNTVGQQTKKKKKKKPNYQKIIRASLSHNVSLQFVGEWGGEGRVQSAVQVFPLHISFYTSYKKRV